MNKTAMNKIDPSLLKIDSNLLTEVSIHGELDIQALVFRQIERTHQAALIDDVSFSSNVRLLFNMVPLHKKKEIAERENEYTSITESWHYKYWCGVPLGTPEEPINGSPALLKETVIDYHKMLEIILEAFEECGITWKFDEFTVETGKVNKKISPDLPTPVFTKTRPDELDEDTEVQQARIRRCAICGDRISPGEGVTFNRKLIHKEKCYLAAQSKWKEN